VEAGAGQVGLCERARREAAAQEEKELPFLFIFSTKTALNPIF
jgi:hypothetical protein